MITVLSRGYKEIVGTFYKDRRSGRLRPDERKFSEDVYIPLSECSHIPDGVKAVATITDYPYGKAPSGVISEVLGDEGDFFAEEPFPHPLLRASGGISRRGWNGRRNARQNGAFPAKYRSGGTYAGCPSSR